MFLKIFTLVLIPALIIQGHQVKKNIIRLAEPSGCREGVVGTGQPLSVLILGDSAAAGVGVEIQEQALLGSILRELIIHYEVYYKLEAKTGHTTVDVLHSVNGMAPQHFDVIVTSMGVNDITKLTSPKRWIKQQKQLYVAINQKFSPQLIVATGVPPMHMFPALPNPLAWLFGKYAQAMNQALSQLVEQQNNLQWVEYDLKKFQRLNLGMAQDGFHPSNEIYTLWGKQVTDKIQQMF